MNKRLNSKLFQFFKHLNFRFVSNLEFSALNFRSQQGVTLLLATLVMAGMTLTILAIAAFSIQEIRASRAIALSEPAISAAESAGEQGLWAIKRSDSLSLCPTAISQNLGANTLSMLCKSYGSARIDVKAGVPFVFYLYNPANINGDVDLHDYPYTNMTVDFISGATSININIIRIDGTTTGISPTTSSVNSGVTPSQVINISPVAVNNEGRMKVTLTSSANATVMVDTDRGMPSFPTVDATGCSSRSAVSTCAGSSQELFTRRIQVTVPQ
jgi:hypothetical protein